ncbi:MAG: hypothetical protein OXC45_01165 [Gemmatimonadetes bacterium]|nr:hypothetical protein [Gemmatimonadota bacterium]
MTTLIAFSTKDVIVMGCDSLGTVSRTMVDPYELFQYFDEEGKLKRDDNGEPLLSNFWKQIHPQNIPYSHLTHVDKLFELHENIGIMTSGIISIGNTTLKSIIQNFAQNFTADDSYTIPCITQQLVDEIQVYYKEEYPDNVPQPEIELLIGGWESNDSPPKIYRVEFPSGDIKLELDGHYGISFGGQFREIARLVHGTDVFNMRLIEDRYKLLLSRFVNELQEANLDQDIILPDLDNFSEKFHIFGLENPDDTSNKQPWRLDGFNADFGDFSTQNAINCVYWLVELMVRVQEFGDSMPTVGGDIHVAMIDRKDGFRFISEEAYKLQGHITPR